MRFLVPNLDLPAICSPRFKPGPPAEEAQVLSDRLNEILVRCALPSLFLFPIVILNLWYWNYDGAVQECCRSRPS